MTTLQLDIGGPLSPASKGPQTKEMDEFEELKPEADKLMVLEVEVDFSTQLLFRNAGNT